MVRLGRFFALVKNEYIKILKKKSTRVMIVLLLLSVVGFCGVFKLMEIEYQSYNYYGVADDGTVDYSEDIDWLNTTKPDDYEATIAKYRFLQENNIPYSDWRYEAVMEFSADNTAGIDEQTFYVMIKNDDWRTYCRYKLDTATTAGDKWEYAYRLETGVGFGDEFEKQNLIISSVNDAKNYLDSDSIGKEDEAAYKETVAIGCYQLDHGIYENTADMTSTDNFELNLDRGTGIGFWNVYMLTPMLVIVAGVIMIVVAGGTVSTEFSQGTIKFLLINPVKRWKILMSKYFTCITFGLILVFVTYIFSIPVTGIFFGFDNLSTPYIYMSDGVIHEVNSFLYGALLYLSSSVEVIVLATFAIAVSSLIRSSALAIGTSVFLMAGGTTITTILGSMGQDWGRYLVFANTDLMSIAQGNSYFPEHTVAFAVAVLAAHMAVFILTAWDGFTKKSV
jgi:ABC-2 type transport system permease protein